MTTNPVLLLEIKESDYQQWRHNPITAAYLQFLEDQANNFREAAADLWEMGKLDPNSDDPNINANVLRGRVMTLRELHTLDLTSIQDFYRSEESDEGQITEESPR